MQMKIKVRLVAPDKTESVNPSHFHMAIVRNPNIVFNFLFTYMKKTTVYTYFA